MNGSWTVVFLGCAMFSFFLSGMEAGVFALSRLRIRHLMRSGNPRAGALLRYLERPENFLWTILVGNTLANVVVSSIGVMWLYGWLRPWPWLLILALVVSVLLFYAACELLPKMLFRHHPNRLCLALVVPFRVVDVALRPVVAPVASLSRLLLKWTGGQRLTGHLFGNRDELRQVMQDSAQALTTEERTMINRERLRFPSGTAAAVTLQSLYADSAGAIRKAKAFAVTPTQCAEAILRGLREASVWLDNLDNRREQAFPQLTAAEIERLVVDELAAIAKAPVLVDRVVAEAAGRHQMALAEARVRLADAERLLSQAQVAAKRAPDDAAQAGLVRQASGQVATLAGAVAELEAHVPDAKVAKRLLGQFEGPWAELSPRERHHLLRGLVERITLDGHSGKVVFSFRSDLRPAEVVEEVTP